MILRIQDPKYPNAPSLHESLLEACRGAVSGGGAFAFVSREGVTLLLKDDVFTSFAKTGSFELVVGVDEITNVKTLEDLKNVSEELNGLTVRVFHHDLKGAIFHPKFCWFKNQSGGVLITGSGNLTGRGLRGSWEAFTVSELSLKEIAEVEKQWADWTHFHSTWLKAPDDAKVLARAAQNIWRPAPGTGEVGAVREKEAEAEVDEIASGPPQQSDAVLVAEISGGDRWTQANFPYEIYKNFFGMGETKEERRVLLQHVDANGALSDWKSQPGVSVKSRNYRIELRAGAGLSYPSKGRPIGVFVRVATRAFRYQLLMPDDSQYVTVMRFLKANYSGPARQLLRVVTKVGTLRQAWPDSPLWRVA